jgi:hypothetical protein
VVQQVLGEAALQQVLGEAALQLVLGEAALQQVLGEADPEGFRSIENKNFPMSTNKNKPRSDIRDAKQ